MNGKNFIHLKLDKNFDRTFQTTTFTNSKDAGKLSPPYVHFDLKTTCNPEVTCHFPHLKGNLAWPIHQKCTPLGCGRKPEHLKETHAVTGRTCKLHIVTQSRNRTKVHGAVSSANHGAALFHCAALLRNTF